MSPTMNRATLLFTALAALVPAGCSSGGNAPAQVYLTSTLGENPSPTATGICNIGQPMQSFFNVGSLDGLISTGGTYAGSAISLTCAVQASNNGFQVQATISSSQYNLSISGDLTNSPGVAQGNINASFGSNIGQTFATNANTNNLCTFTLTTDAPQGIPITAGRVWGTLTCPSLVYAESNNTCEGTATIVLQNCEE